MSGSISLEEVKKHNKEESVWMVIHNDVYDVTAFLEEHPGGADSLLEYGGKDGTQAFEDVAHSEDARELMKKFKIGNLPESERIQPKSKHAEYIKWAAIALAGAIIIGFAIRSLKSKSK